MNLLDTEKVLAEIDGGELVLTSHRVQSDRPESLSSGTPAEFVSIMLEEVSSCQITQKSHRWLGMLSSFFLGAACCGALSYVLLPELVVSQILRGLGLDGGFGILVGLLGIGGALALLYHFTTSREVIIASSSASIRHKIGSPHEFIEALESAKNDRYLSSNVVEGLGARTPLRKTGTRAVPLSPASYTPTP